MLQMEMVIYLLIINIHQHITSWFHYEGLTKLIARKFGVLALKCIDGVLQIHFLCLFISDCSSNTTPRTENKVSNGRAGGGISLVLCYMLDAITASIHKYVIQHLPFFTFLRGRFLTIGACSKNSYQNQSRSCSILHCRHADLSVRLKTSHK